MGRRRTNDLLDGFASVLDISPLVDAIFPEDDPEADAREIAACFDEVGQALRDAAEEVHGSDSPDDQ